MVYKREYICVCMSNDLDTKARQRGNERNEFIILLGKEKKRGKANEMDENDFHNLFFLLLCHFWRLKIRTASFE